MGCTENALWPRLRSAKRNVVGRFLPNFLALRKSVGDDIAEDAFGKWMTTQSKTPKNVSDPVADALVAALSNLSDYKSLKLGNKGYVVRRAKGKGASGFVAQKVV